MDVVIISHCIHISNHHTVYLKYTEYRLPRWLVVKNPPANALDERDVGSILGQEDPLEEEITTQAVFLPGESHGQRSHAGYIPKGRKE